MAKIGKLPSRNREPAPTTTPFDMLPISIGDTDTVARPYEVVTAPDGTQYPSRASTSCPSCGHGVDVIIRQDILLSGARLTAQCDNCGAGRHEPVRPLEDPFRNPVVDGIIARHELDVMYATTQPGSPEPGSANAILEKSAAKKIAERRRKGGRTDDVSQHILPAAPIPPVSDIDLVLINNDTNADEIILPDQLSQQLLGPASGGEEP